MSFTSFNFFLSTAEEERVVFIGHSYSHHQPDLSALLPAGVYRVVNGE